MTIFKKIILYFILLIVMIICGTATIKIYDKVLNLNYNNIWATGFKVGFIAWCLMLAYIYYRNTRNK